MDAIDINCFDPANHAITWGSQNVDSLSLHAFLRDNLTETDEGAAVKLSARWVLDIECELLHALLDDYRAKLVEAHERNSLEPFDVHLRNLHQLLRVYQAAYKALAMGKTDRRTAWVAA